MTASDDATDVTSTAPTNASPATPAAAAEADGSSNRRRPTRRRRVLLVLLFLLTCLAILTSSVTVWVHQTVLNTDRWVSLVGPVAANPAVQAAMSEQIASQVIIALDVQQKLVNVLPPKAGFAAGPITQALQDQIQQRLAKRMASPEFQQAWITANRVAHAQIVRILRGDTPNLTIADGYIHLDLWPLIGQALTQLQQAGLIPADANLPDVSNGLSPGAQAVIEKVLGVTLPADFGTVRLMPADKLVQAQQYVRYFDLITIATVLLAILLILVTIWYAPRRRWMVIYLAIGGAVAIILARFALQSVAGSIIDSLDDGDTATTVRGVLSAVFDDLYGFTRLIVIGSIVIAIVAYLTSRPRWLVSLNARISASRQKPAAAMGAPTGAAAAPASGSAMTPAATTTTTSTAATTSAMTPATTATTAGQGTDAPASTTMGWAREHIAGLRIGGLAVIAFVIAWAAFGLELALLGALLVVLLEVVLHALASGKDSAGDKSGPSSSTTSA